MSDLCHLVFDKPSMVALARYNHRTKQWEYRQGGHLMVRENPDRFFALVPKQARETHFIHLWRHKTTDFIVQATPMGYNPFMDAGREIVEDTYWIYSPPEFGGTDTKGTISKENLEANYERILSDYEREKMEMVEWIRTLESLLKINGVEVPAKGKNEAQNNG